MTERYRILENTTSLIHDTEDDSVLTAIGTVHELNELLELSRIAARLRARIGYAYVSEAAVFQFIEDWDKATKKGNKKPD